MKFEPGDLVRYTQYDPVWDLRDRIGTVVNTNDFCTEVTFDPPASFHTGTHTSPYVVCTTGNLALWTRNPIVTNEDADVVKLKEAIAGLSLRNEELSREVESLNAFIGRLREAFQS